MKFVALVSGGKDSIYSILTAVKEGHELVACVHLSRPLLVAESESSVEESYMYQTAASEAVQCQVEECMGVPLILHPRTGSSVNTTLVYETSATAGTHDEVEDLYVALQKAKEQFPDVQAVSSGAILSTYQRVRVEHVCLRLNLQSLSYLWRVSDQKQLLQNMMDANVTAVLVKTAAPPGLIPTHHLGQTLQQLQPHFDALHAKYQFHVCGEGGEYESLVLDCPGLFRKRLVLDEVEIVQDDAHGVGVLLIKSCHAEDKEDNNIAILETTTRSRNSPKCARDNAVATPSVQSTNVSTCRPSFSPHVRRVQGGLWSVSEITSPRAAFGDDESEAAVTETLQIFHILQQLLHRINCTVQDVLMVHLYLSEISHFTDINTHYRDFFGVLLPPSRSTVAVGGGRRVLLDCLVQCGSGESMRTAIPTNPYAKASLASSHSKLREVLHVQSISHWAPVCVGPYSQVNTVRSCLHMCAGQIGLVPATMKLREGWAAQLTQCWTNVANVLDALDGASLQNVLSCLLYVADSVFHEEEASTKMQLICKSQMETNGGVVPGRIDGTAKPTGDLDGYEDEETRREVENTIFRDDDDIKLQLCPVLVVSIPQMPVGALTEVEVVAASSRAVSCIEITESCISRNCPEYLAPAVDCAPFFWDTGHDFHQSNGIMENNLQIEAFFRFLGSHAAACALVTVRFRGVTPDNPHVDPIFVLIAMLKALRYEHSFDADNILHVRLYYVDPILNSDRSIVLEDDGTLVRSALQAAIWSSFTAPRIPATTVIPVRGMCILNHRDGEPSCTTFFALQAISADPVRMEQSLWIKHGR